MPETVTFAHDLDLIERVATVLDLSEWHWTILDVLIQPDALLDDIIKFKGLTGKIRRQIDNRERARHRGGVGTDA